MTSGEGAALWEALKDQISEAVLLLSGENIVLDANEAAAMLLHKPRKEMAGASLSLLFGDTFASMLEEKPSSLFSFSPAQGKERKLSYVLLPLENKEEQIKKEDTEKEDIENENIDKAQEEDTEKEGIEKQEEDTEKEYLEKTQGMGRWCLLIRDETERQSLLDTAASLEELNKKLELQNRLLEETFGRYFSDSILKTLLDTPGGLSPGGRRQELTILMSDLRGFTMISESLPPEGLISLLNHYLGEMTGVIQNRGGTIIEFIGDGIMALFGAPVRRTTHAEEAVAAAIEMQERMEGVNAWNRERGFPSLEMGIGVHTGEAILGNIGSEKRMKYGVVGDSVNIAGRIESYTVGGQILISENTRRMISVPLGIVRELEVLPKGMSAPLLLHQVSAIGEPYGAGYSLPEEGLVPLRIPQIVRFSRTEGKRRGRKMYPGQVRARSEREFLLSTREVLEEFENLTFQVPGEKEFYGKVLGRRPGGWLVHRTSV